MTTRYRRPTEKRCCRRLQAPWFDCKKHATEARGWCAYCRSYDLIRKPPGSKGKIFCGACGAGPLIDMASLPSSERVWA